MWMLVRPKVAFVNCTFSPRRSICQKQVRGGAKTIPLAIVARVDERQALCFGGRRDVELGFPARAWTSCFADSTRDARDDTTPAKASILGNVRM